MKHEYQEEEEGMGINDNFDFGFAVKLSPVLRWVLVLPMGIVGLLIVWSILGWLVGMAGQALRPEGWAAVALNAPVDVIKYAVSVIAMVATAPVERQKKFFAGVMLGTVALLLPLINLIVVQISMRAEQDMEIADRHIMSASVLLACAMLGIWIAIRVVGGVTNKHSSEPENHDDIE